MGKGLAAVERVLVAVGMVLGVDARVFEVKEIGWASADTWPFAFVVNVKTTCLHIFAYVYTYIHTYIHVIKHASKETYTETNALQHTAGPFAFVVHVKTTCLYM